jgi:hypothetical protein
VNDQILANFPPPPVLLANCFSQMFGGVPASNQCRFSFTDASTPAVRQSYRTKVTWSRDPVTSEIMYSHNGWLEEDMLVPRTGGDAVALPNGGLGNAEALHFYAAEPDPKRTQVPDMQPPVKLGGACSYLERPRCDLQHQEPGSMPLFC